MPPGYAPFPWLLSNLELPPLKHTQYKLTFLLQILP